MTPKILITMVQSFILANFNYCPLVWYFTSAKQINKIEKILEIFQMIMTVTINSSLKAKSLYQWKLKGSKHYVRKYLKL